MHSFSARHALLSIVTVLAIGGTVHAQSPVGTVSNIPFPDANAYSTSLRYDSSGNLYAWDGLSVWEQSGGTGTFNNIGSVTAGNSADAGPISFSQDGQTLLLSNGAGGFQGGAYNGVFWTMPASGGAATQVTGGGVPYTGDAVALPAASTIPGSGTKYIVYAGTSITTTAVRYRFSMPRPGRTRWSSTTAPEQRLRSPSIRKTIASTSASVTGPDAGNIYSFSLSQIDSAYRFGNPDQLSLWGTLFNPAGDRLPERGGNVLR